MTVVACSDQVGGTVSREGAVLRFGNVEVRPLGGRAGCLIMVLVSLLASVLLTVLLNLIL